MKRDSQKPKIGKKPVVPCDTSDRKGIEPDADPFLRAARSAENALCKLYLSHSPFGSLLKSMAPKEKLAARKLALFLARGNLVKADWFNEVGKEALAKHDKKFFIRLGESLKCEAPELPDWQLRLVLFWVHLPKDGRCGCFCVWTDEAITDFLRLTLNPSFTLDLVRKTRQRLGLVKARPIIVRGIECVDDKGEKSLRYV